MTTKLAGKDTYFLPFNQGSNGAGQDGGKGILKLSISVDRLISRIHGVRRQRAKSHKSAAA